MSSYDILWCIGGIFMVIGLILNRPNGRYRDLGVYCLGIAVGFFTCDVIVHYLWL